MLLVGGIQYISSGGDKGEIERARSRLASAMIGLIILFSFFIISNFIDCFFGVHVLRIRIGEYDIGFTQAAFCRGGGIITPPGGIPTVTATLTPSLPPTVNTPTPTPPPSQLSWAAGYPARMLNGSNKQAMFKVRLLSLTGVPINNASVYLYNQGAVPPYLIGLMASIGNGYYGRSPSTSYGDCFTVPAAGNVLVTVRTDGATDLSGITTAVDINTCP
jgi:hypothetical protein